MRSMNGLETNKRHPVTNIVNMYDGRDEKVPDKEGKSF